MADEPIKKPIVDEVATAEKDIDIFAGWLNRLENPDPVLRSEAGGKGLKLYDEVDRDAHAGSVLQTRYLAVVGREWEIVPAESGKKLGRPGSVTQEQKIADFIKTSLLDCNFDQFRHELLQAILYGHYEGEIIWAVRDNQVVISRLLAKHPRRFIFTPDRDLRLLTLSNMIDGEPVPERKFIILTYGSSDNPYGKGLGQSLWWPVWFKKNGIKFWLIFAEKFGSPTPIGKYPAGATAEQKRTLMAAIESIQQETGITIPEGMAIDLLEATRAGTINTYEKLCEYMDKQISKRVLGQTATTEGTPGKLGNEQTQAEVRADIIKADADLLCECLNNSLIKWLVDYNFGPQAAYPKIWIRTDPEEDLKPLAERDKIILVDMGMGKRVSESYIADTYGIPLAEEGEATIDAPRAANPVLSKFSENRKGNMQFSEIDDWISEYMHRLRPAMQDSRAKAMDDIETWLKSLSAPPSATELRTKATYFLGNSYGVTPRAAIADMVTNIYKSVWETSGAEAALGGADLRSVNFLSKLDNFYFSKWIENLDAQAALHNFISERYLTDGAGLFGRGNAGDIQAFRDLLGQKIGDIEDWQIRRITDTAVTRVRNWGSVSQLRLGGITEIEVIEPTRECEFCARMNGRVINVATAYATMADQSTMSPEKYVAELKAYPSIIDNIDAIVAKGMLPPYHPHCRGIVVKKMA